MYFIVESSFRKNETLLKGTQLKAVPHTMQLHQILWDRTSSRDIKYRDVSCLCTANGCDCFEPGNACICESKVSNIVSETEYGTLIGQYVVVRYDGSLYPGKVVDEDVGDVKVNCMSKIGENRFYWPTREDICYYMRDDVVSVIPEPERVTGRHMQVTPSIWHTLN